MKKKDLIIILIALALVGGVFLVGARGNFFKEKLRLKKQAAEMPAAGISPDVSKNEQKFLGENYSNFSENISVFSPRPQEIIKGTTFWVKGQARVFENVVLVKIKDGESADIWLATSTLAASPDIGQFGGFEIKIDVSPFSGWATLEVFSDSPKDGSVINLVSFPIKISASL